MGGWCISLVVSEAWLKEGVAFGTLWTVMFVWAGSGKASCVFRMISKTVAFWYCVCVLCIMCCGGGMRVRGCLSGCIDCSQVKVEAKLRPVALGKFPVLSESLVIFQPILAGSHH